MPLSSPQLCLHPAFRSESSKEFGVNDDAVTGIDERVLGGVFQRGFTINDLHLVVGSNDATQEFIPVNLVGESAIPDLTVFPDPLDMGTVNVGCTATNNIFLQKYYGFSAS